MDDQQQFCLRWNDFQTNMVASFKHLRDEKSFCDVTLACDGQSTKAHKMILSACSPYFKALLEENPAKHPIIILKDVPFQHLTAILEFMYAGEVNVAQVKSIYYYYVPSCKLNNFYFSISGSVTSIPENSWAFEGERSRRGPTVCKGRVNSEQESETSTMYRIMLYHFNFLPNFISKQLSEVRLLCCFKVKCFCLKFK